MRARRGTALLLSCVLGLLLLTPVHAAAQPTHVVRHVALAPVGAETPQSWRSAPDDAVSADAHRAVIRPVRTAAAATTQGIATHDIRTPQVRGPPGSALV